MLLNEKEHNMEKQLPGHKQKGIAHNEILYQLSVESNIQIKANVRIIQQGKKLRDVAACGRHIVVFSRFCCMQHNYSVGRP